MSKRTLTLHPGAWPHLQPGVGTALGDWIYLKGQSREFFWKIPRLKTGSLAFWVKRILELVEFGTYIKRLWFFLPRQSFCGRLQSSTPQRRTQRDRTPRCPSAFLPWSKEWCCALARQTLEQTWIQTLHLELGQSPRRLTSLAANSSCSPRTLAWSRGCCSSCYWRYSGRHPWSGNPGLGRSTESSQTSSPWMTRWWAAWRSTGTHPFFCSPACETADRPPHTWCPCSL